MAGFACIAEIMVLDPTTGTRDAVRVASANVRSVTALGGVIWVPSMVQPASLGIALWNGDFQAAVAPASAQFSINMGETKRSFPNADARIWIGAPVTIMAEKIGTAGPWSPRFSGRITSIDRKAQLLNITVEVDQEPHKANVLTATYAGTGGAEGGADIKGKVKPLALGWTLNVEPVLIDADNSVYQFSGYGAIEAVSHLFERGSDFGAAQGNYSSYANLVAATIPAGRWATCLAEGLIRLGAPAYGVITGDIKGHKIGSATPRLTGAIISALAGIAGVSSGLINSTSLSALDSDVPYNVNLVLTDQTTFLDIAQQMALACNYQAGLDLLGEFFVSAITVSGSPAITIDAKGHALPQIISSDEQDVSVPYYRTALGANRAWRVHTPDEIAFDATIIDKGAYDSGATYRDGNTVSLPDGSTWIYFNPSPTSGNAPPAWPTTSNTWWENLSPPLTASDLTYVDGTPIEDLKPAEIGATQGAPTGTPVGSITADDVAGTINSGGGVAAGQVDTNAIIANAVTKAAQAANGSMVVFTGLTNWTNVIAISITMASAGDLVLVAPVQLTFSGFLNYQYILVASDGTTDFVLQSGSGNIDHYITGAGSITLAAGTYTCRLDMAADIGVSINGGGADLIADRRYR